MDGLLIDSEPLWLEVETAVMARLGAEWSEEDQARLLGVDADPVVPRAAPSRPAEGEGRARPKRWQPNFASATGETTLAQFHLS